MSKFVKEAQTKIAKHRHCVVCQNPISEMEKEFCSQKCEESYKKRERTRKYTTLLMVLILPLMLLLMLLLRPS